MDIYFVTGNAGKLAEVQAGLPNIRGLALDLPEIQELDVKKIITAKLTEATRLHPGALLVEDTSLHCEGLRGLPGPLVKWFLQALGPDGLYDLVAASGNTKATARTTFGLSSGETLHFFEGEVRGRIVPPQGSNGFGWDPIFQLDGQSKTFAEMKLPEKNSISHRARAIEKLRSYIDSIS